MIRIRPAVPADAATIVDYQLRMAMETEGVRLDAPTVRAGVRAAFADPAGKGSYYLAEVDGRVAGCLLILTEWSDWRNGTFWWIHSVYVEPEHRGKGVFKAMYAHLKEQVLRSADLRGLRLYVDQRNVRAQRTYERLGMNGEHYRMYEWIKGP